MPTPRGPGVGAVDGVVYAIGGYNPPLTVGEVVEAYNPDTDSWTTKTPMPTPRYAHAVAVANGVVYALGGYDGNQVGGILNTMDAYDPATNTSSRKAPMSRRRYVTTAASVDGVLYAIGGFDGGGFVSALEAYDPTTNTWSLKAPMPTARYGAAAGVIDGKIYVVGGSTCACNLPLLGTLEVYDPATNTWSTKAPMPTARWTHGVAVVDGLLYAIGGNAHPFNSAFLDVVEAYDPATDTWTTMAPMPTKRYGFAVAVVNGRGYVIGGAGIGGQGEAVSLGTNEEFTPPSSDFTPPILNLPNSFAVDATSPDGAVVTYVASALDDVDGTVSVVCTPPSGALFPVGVTEVGCTASDTSGNGSEGAFLVTVRSATEMADVLIALTSEANLSQSVNLLASVRARAEANNLAAACNGLSAFVNQAQARAGKSLTEGEAAALVDYAQQVQAALGCP